jgi:6-methylsalicylate decarboxylase
MRIDIHQHLWTDPLVAALAARETPPYVRFDGGEAVLHAPGETPALLATGPEEIDRRVERLEADGLDLALVCLSSPLGIEALPREEALPLIDAYEEGVSDLPEGFRAWGAIALDGLDPDDVDDKLDRGFVGVSLPAEALSSPRRIDRLLPVLQRLEERDRPLLVHPGPAPPVPGGGDPRAPEWWQALTSYVFGMHAAWLAFLAEGRAQVPALRVVFVMLAGCAPVHHERLVARGGPAGAADRLTFYDTSSYGAQALDAMVRCVGIEQVVYGSDRPVVEPAGCPLGDAAREATLSANPLRLIDGEAVPA